MPDQLAKHGPIVPVVRIMPNVGERERNGGKKVGKERGALLLGMATDVRNASY